MSHGLNVDAGQVVRHHATLEHHHAFDNNGLNASKVITKSHLNSITLVNVHLKLLSPEAFFSPKCTKYRLAAGLRTGPAGGAYSAPRPP